MSQDQDLRLSDGPLGRILLVEDDEVFANTLEDMLVEIGGDDIIRAVTVEEAMRKLQSASPTIVILDASLRGITAHTVAARLHDEGVPFIVSTGYDLSTLPEAFKYGVPLKKPYSRQALATALAAALGSRKSN